MKFSPFLFLLFLFPAFSSATELTSLLDLKASLDPENLHLGSWVGSGNPCDGTFEGVACNEKGQVANISLQGKGLAGKLSPALAGLTHLTGLYLHYNSLHGEIPIEIANLTELTDLYLNVNNLSGEIPSLLGDLRNLHGRKVQRSSLVHQNVSAKNVLIDQWSKPLLSDSCLHKLLTDDTVFSTLKASAAMGYLAPEYTTTGRFTEKSDVYAFGVLVFQILSGKRKYAASVRASAESCSLEFIDTNLGGKFVEAEAAMLARLYICHCS